MLKRAFLACVAAFALSGAASAQEVRLATLDWPPYLTPSLPKGGATAAVVAAVFEKAGMTLANDFMPFNRAVQSGTTDPAYAGYYAEYISPEIEARCNLSAPVGRGPVGFVEKKDSAFTWSSVADLSSQVIGVVDGYVNDGAEFDAAVAAGTVKVEKVADDLTNLKKVAAGRIEAAVVDANVFRFLASSEPSLSGALRMDEKILKDHALYICFAKTAEGAAIRDRFNAALAQLDPVALQAAYMAEHVK